MEFLDPKKVVAALSIFHGATVADFGCGPGDFSFAVASLVGPAGTVYALDIRREVLSRVESTAREKGISNIETLVADLERKNGALLGDETCDFVIVSNILFLVQNKESFLEEAGRILKKGGKMLVVDWSESHGGLGPTKDMVVHQDTARALFDKTGFVVLSEIPAGAYHYGYILSKP